MKTAKRQIARNVWSAIAQLMLLVTVAEARATECSMQRARTSNLSHYVTMFVVKSYMESGLVPYAGNDPNPRPMPKISLHDLRSEGQAFLTYDPEARDLYKLENLFSFAFREERYASPNPDVISASRASLWCLITEGDLVLLSDRVTHHVTRVFKVDHDRGKVYFIDRWPDQFFLREGLNTMGIQAKALVPDMTEIIARIKARRFPGVDEKTNIAWNQNELTQLALITGNTRKEIIEISKDDFMKTAVGLVTVDTVDLANQYLSTDPHVKLAFATTLLHAADRYADAALNLCKRALALARQSGDSTVERISAARVFFSATLLLFRSIEHNDETTAKRAQAELQAISSTFDGNGLMKLWDATDFYRAGHAAGAANQLKHSLWYFDRALELNPQYEEAYLYRANARTHQVTAAVVETGDPASVCNEKRTLEEAISDLEQALLFNQKAAGALETIRKSRDPRDRYGIAADQGKQKTLEDRSVTAKKMQASARFLFGQCN